VRILNFLNYNYSNNSKNGQEKQKQNLSKLKTARYGKNNVISFKTLLENEKERNNSKKAG
jgi:hypothetical protein